MAQRDIIIRRQMELSNLIGCPGHESQVAEYILDCLRDLCDESWIDSLGNVLAVRRGGGTRILLDGHTDEVGFMVTHVDEDGFVRIESLGGVDRRLLLGSLLEFLADDGSRITGVVGAAPPHITTPAERENVPAINEMFVDLGFAGASEVADRGLHVGSVGAFSTSARMLGEDLMLGKAFDDRTACNVILQVLANLAGTKCRNTVVCNFAVQEEVGTRGAGTGAFALEPDLALAIENTVASDVPGVPASRMVSALGKGPAITVADRSHIVPRHLIDALQRAAGEGPWQYKKPLYGGTDAGKIAVTRSGVPTAVVSVPCRYIHSPAALLRISDIEATVGLVTRFCEMDHAATRGLQGPSHTA